jgi:acetyltransferase-like isoleucine patch superfamily enzyme
VNTVKDRFSRGLYEQIFSRVPFTPGIWLRRFFLRCVGADIGDACIVGTRVHIVAPQQLCLRERTSISPGAILDCRGGLFIGASSMVGIQAILLTSSHCFERTDVPMRDQGMRYAPVRIGEDVWIGARAVILSGVTIGRGSIIAAGAVVTKDIEPFGIVAGVPAQVLRSRIESNL